MRLTLAVRAPNHLGDGVMALPAIRALTELGRVTIHAPHWGPALYRDLPAAVAPRGTMAPADVAVLFPPSLRAAIEARRCPRRIGTPTDHRRWLLTDPVAPRTHTAQTYAGLVEVLGARVHGPPRYRARASDPAVRVVEGHIGLNPISVSGAVRQWPGFAELASRLDRPVVFYGGPGERARVAPAAGPHPLQIGLSLPAFAHALQRCAVFVSNDSGAAHFARACGVPTVVIFGSTTASRTGPDGCVAVEGPSLSCRPCYGPTCPTALECLEIGVEPVLAAVREALGG